MEQKKTINTKPAKAYEIVALESASGPLVTIHKGGTYKVPGQIGDKVARNLIKAKLAKKK